MCLVGDNTYERRDLEVGLSDGLVTEVLSGVTAEDKVKIWNQPVRMTFPEARLRTGLPAVEAKAFAKEASSHPEWVEELIRISSYPDGGTVPRKAAWVLRHAALHNPACVAYRGVALLDAVDDSQDTSVHRELLKGACWKLQRRSSDVWAQNCLRPRVGTLRRCQPSRGHGPCGRAVAARLGRATWRRGGGGVARTRCERRNGTAGALSCQTIGSAQPPLTWHLKTCRSGAWDRETWASFSNDGFRLGVPVPEPFGDWLSLE